MPNWVKTLARHDLHLDQTHHCRQGSQGRLPGANWGAAADADYRLNPSGTGRNTNRPLQDCVTAILVPARARPTAAPSTPCRSSRLAREEICIACGCAVAASSPGAVNNPGRLNSPTPGVGPAQNPVPAVWYGALLVREQHAQECIRPVPITCPPCRKMKI
jgi:hypothetical protein